MKLGEWIVWAGVAVGLLGIAVLAVSIMRTGGL
jgi:hypothetical protein